MSKPKLPENLEQRAIRLHRDIYAWAVEQHRENPSIGYLEMQDAIYAHFGKEHLIHSFDIMLIAKEAVKDNGGR